MSEEEEGNLPVPVNPKDIEFEEKKKRFGPHTRRARTENKPHPYPTCGGLNREGVPCGHAAGKGTDHVGQGRCFLHGGASQTPTAKNWKHGMNSSIIYPSLLDKVEELRQSRDIYDLREHILLLEATVHFILKEANTVEDLFPAVKVIDTASKVVHRLNEIEHGRRLVISVDNVGHLVNRVVDIVERHVPDPYVRSLVAADLMQLYNAPRPELLVAGKAPVVMENADQE